MLTIQASGTESLWDEILPAEVKALPEDLARLDELLADPGLLAPIAVRWERLLAETGACAGRGRPTIAMETYVRLMIVKHRSGWGYETLMREVSDSIHLRRFCRIGMSERVPDESTVRKLTRRLGAEVVHEITRELIQKARREKRFRPRAARIDSTVVEADVKYPTDSGLADAGVRALAREGRKLAAKIGEKRTAVRDRSQVDGPQAAGADALDPPPLGGGEGRGAGADRADRARCSSSRSARRASSPRPPGVARAGAARVRSSRPPRRWRSSPIAARR